MTISVAEHAPPAVCRWVDQQGRLVVFTAVARRVSPGLEPYKCDVPGNRDLAHRVRTVLSQARVTEPRFDSRWLVHVSLSTSEFDAADPHWELAAVLVDRMARGQFTALSPTVWAHGASTDWTTGSVFSDDGSVQVLQRMRAHALGLCQFVMASSRSVAESGVVDDCVPTAYPVELTIVSHLGGLTGQPDPARSVARASAWFPLVAGGDGDSDTLSRVDVAVREQAVGDGFPVAGDHDPSEVIEVNGLPWTQRHAACSVVTSARMLDRNCTRRWHTVISFNRLFHMKSYELALVLADRMARGRLLSPRGRLIATGASENWSTGVVQPVDGVEAKCRLIARVAAAGDRVLLPAPWWPQLPSHFESSLRQRGVSLAAIAEVRDLGAPSRLSAITAR